MLALTKNGLCSSSCLSFPAGKDSTEAGISLSPLEVLGFGFASTYCIFASVFLIGEPVKKSQDDDRVRDGLGLLQFASQTAHKNSAEKLLIEKVPACLGELYADWPKMR